MLSSYTAVVMKSGNWYAGFVKELPGAHSQGKSIEEVKENLKESIKMIIESNYDIQLKDIKILLNKK